MTSKQNKSTPTNQTQTKNTKAAKAQSEANTKRQGGSEQDRCFVLGYN